MTVKSLAVLKNKTVINFKKLIVEGYSLKRLHFEDSIGLTSGQLKTGSSQKFES